jgi:hypothetical protein
VPLDIFALVILLAKDSKGIENQTPFLVGLDVEFILGLQVQAFVN